jgi:hypothetical protein
LDVPMPAPVPVAIPRNIMLPYADGIANATQASARIQYFLLDKIDLVFVRCSQG